jgi:hypothetical protein
MSMSNAIVFLLIAVGANVNAEDVVAEILLDRASSNIVGEVLVDMDYVTHAKPAKASGGAAKTAARPKSGVTTKRNGARGPIQGQYTAIKAPSGIQRANTYTGRLFGGTNTKNNEKADMAIFKGKGAQMYGRAMGTSGNGGKVMGSNIGSGPLFQRFGLAPKASAVPTRSSKKPAGVFTPIGQSKLQSANKYSGRVFGGTNSKNNPKADMAILKGKGQKMYGRVMGTGGNGENRYR